MKIILEKLWSLILEYKKSIVFCVAVIGLFLIGFYAMKTIDGVKEDYYDRKYNINSTSLADRDKMTEAQRLKFENDRRDILDTRGTPIVQEVVRTQYIQGQTPKTVFSEVQHVARGGDSKLISQSTQDKIREKSDETKIIEEEKSVDVYKINHEKVNKFKVGATYLDNKAYLNIGYQHKRSEIIIHTDGLSPKINGATYMWTVYQK